MARGGGQHNNNTNCFGSITPPYDRDTHPCVQYTMDDLTVLVWFLFPIFNGSNYNTWRRSMLIAFNAKINLVFRLKILWDELKDFQLVPVCNRGGMKIWVNYQQHEYVMQFFVGLNESYSAIRVQILMLDLLPNGMCSIWLFKKNNNSMAFSTISSTSFVIAISSQSMKRNDRPICSHCGIMGHIVDRYYKLHGYLPGYKPKEKAQQQQQSSFQSNSKTSVSSSTAVPSSFAMTTTASSSSPGDLTADQCQQLIAYLSTQLH
ncbi:hypothetical protein ACOSQ2_002411 [Xanthoceras sorbifolium]